MKGYDNFFMVEKESFDFKDFKFLIKAKGSDSNRWFMRFIFVDKEDDYLVMVATDGYRMHIIRPDKNFIEKYGIQEGHYQVIANTAGVIIFAHIDANETSPAKINTGTFPNWRKVLPEGEPEKTQMIEVEKQSTRSIINFSRNLDEQESFNIDYFNDLSGFEWKVEYRGIMKGINFISGNKQAVIMPMTM